MSLNEKLHLNAKLVNHTLLSLHCNEDKIEQNAVGCENIFS